MVTPTLIEVPLEEIEVGQDYLLRICGEWFTGGFAADGQYWNRCGGRSTMWDDHTLTRLAGRGLLEAVYRIEE